MKNIFLSLLFLSMIFISCRNTEQINTPPTAKNGILDLKDWDFTKQDSIELQGEWKFKWMEDSEEFILPDFDDSDWEYYPMPSSWRDNGKGNFGYCWYRIKIKLKPTKGLGIYILV